MSKMFVQIAEYNGYSKVVDEYNMFVQIGAMSMTFVQVIDKYEVCASYWGV